MKHKLFTYSMGLAFVLAVWTLSSCGDAEIDNAYSRNESVIKLTASSENVVLDESRPDDVALTIEWNAATDHGNDFLVTYQYQMELVGSTAGAKKEYEDEGHFVRTYTNRELQEMLTNHFGQSTSTRGTLRFTLTATFAGPRTIVPDISTLNVMVKTYGPKQFLADRLFMAGTAVGAEQMELSADERDPMIYRYNGKLSAGTVCFPVLYADEDNALSPQADNTPITTDEMEAQVVDRKDAKYWVVPEESNYRVTINLKNHTVKIVEAGSVIELNRLFLAGSATGGEDIEVCQTLENENVYAWRGELKAGKLWMPIEFEEMTAVSIVPKGTDHGIHDAQQQDFAQVATDAGTAQSYWEIPANDTYRIVVNLTTRSVVIYSSARDMKTPTVSYNNTSLGINPYTAEVTRLWMYGTFNGFAHDSGLFNGFQEKYSLAPSLANPNVFVYKGEDLPRQNGQLQYKLQDGTATAQGAVLFFCDNFNNNMWAWGSTAPAKRNSYSGIVTPKLGAVEGVVAGQSDNRYAYFIIPEGCNYVEVDVENKTVVFDIR